MTHRKLEVAENVRQSLLKFCGDDAGRSAALCARHPALPMIEIRGDAPRPAASVMKVPLLMALYKGLEKPDVQKNEPIGIEAFPPTRYVSILSAFDPDRTLTLREVCKLALITSDNPLIVELQGRTTFDAVNALLARLGVDPACRMAAGFTEAELGPKNRVNVLTARSAVEILEAIRDDPAYADLMIGLKNNLRNNRIPALLPDHVDVYHKTGSLEGVVNDVGILSDGRIEFTIAFLTEGQGDAAVTSNDIATCAKDVYDAFHAVDKGE